MHIATTFLMILGRNAFWIALRIADFDHPVLTCPGERASSEPGISLLSTIKNLSQYNASCSSFSEMASLPRRYFDSAMKMSIGKMILISPGAGYSSLLA